MKALMKLACTAVSLAVLGGCANISSVYRRPDLNDGRSMVIDAEQTAIISSNGAYTLCARPAPDAIAAESGGFTFNGAFTNDQSVDMGGAGGQGVAGIGLRTQSIQLLRDSMYRNCEALQNGAIDSFEFGIMQRRFQTNLIAILAVEQLTGAVRGPAAATGAQTEVQQGDGPTVTTNVDASATTPGISAGDRAAVAQAVQHITETAMAQDYSWQMCFEVLRLHNHGTDDLRDYCRAYMNADFAWREATRDNINALLSLATNPDLDAAERASIMQAVETLQRQISTTEAFELAPWG